MRRFSERPQEIEGEHGHLEGLLDEKVLEAHVARNEAALVDAGQLGEWECKLAGGRNDAD